MKGSAYVLSEQMDQVYRDAEKAEREAWRAMKKSIAELEAALVAIIAIDDADGISANYCGCQPELKKAMADARAAVARVRNT